MNRLPSAFDKIYPEDKEAPTLFESQVTISIRHPKLDMATMKEAFFEIQQRTKNLVKEVFKEYGIPVPSDIKVML